MNKLDISRRKNLYWDNLTRVKVQVHFVLHKCILGKQADICCIDSFKEILIP